MAKGVTLLKSGNDESASVNHYLYKHFPNGVPDSTTALSDLHLDSLELIETLFELEQHSGKTLSNLELSSLTTLGDLVRFFSHPANPQE